MPSTNWTNDKDCSELSDVQLERLQHQPTLPSALCGDYELVKSAKQIEQAPALREGLYKALPNIARREDEVLEFVAKNHSPSNSKAVRVGIVFCGRQTPGGHNIVSGLFDFLKARNPDSAVVGFLGGSKGLLAGEAVELTAEYLAKFRNQGGLDLLGRTVDMVHGDVQQKAALEACNKFSLDGLILIGGPYTHTDAALLADFFLAHGSKCAVEAVPCGIDGDLHTPVSESVVGFDTATKVFSQLIGNIAIDGISARKYYFFMRLMGRQHSHVTLECGLATHPNYVLIGEEVQAKKKTLRDITNELADMISSRAETKQNYGVVLVPEGMVSFIPELSALIQELNDLFARGVKANSDVTMHLTPWNQALFKFLPEWFTSELLIERESHGNIQHSQVQMERLLIDLLKDELGKRKSAGTYKGSFNAIPHYVGYQARGSLPSNFDCNLGYALGAAAGGIVLLGRSGFMLSAGSLNKPASEWTLRAVPLSRVLSLVDKDGKPEPVVTSSKVDLNGGAFMRLAEQRGEWVASDEYRNPGPIQFGGPTADAITFSLREHYKKA